jgi:hypothetical protein
MVRFLLRSRLIVLVILFVPLVWTLLGIELVELDAILVNILKFFIAGLVVAIPITTVVVSIVLALASVIVGIVLAMASVLVCIILVTAISGIALVVPVIVTAF